MASRLITIAPKGVRNNAESTRGCRRIARHGDVLGDEGEFTERNSIRFKDMQPRILLVDGDITQLDVDAIVTAANEALAGGHGVDGAVHRAAGPELFAECQALRYCDEGDAKITRGYNLLARHVIHTVGPFWEGGEYGERETLRSCYLRSLQLAIENDIQTLAFPCVATGAHDFPNELAYEIAFETVSGWLQCHDAPMTVTFCCFDEYDYRLYEQKLLRSSADN